MTLLPDREIATFKALLAGHPEIVIVARNRVEGMGKRVGHSDQGNREPHGPRVGGPSKCPISFGRIPLAEVARLMTSRCDRSSKADTVIIVPRSKLACPRC